MDDAGAPDLEIFSRILCGVDGTPESLAAVVQAMRLLDSGGTLEVAVAADVAKAAHAGVAAAHAAELLQQEAEEALAAARESAPAAVAKVLNGEPAGVLLREAEVERATLIAVGSHGRGRAAAMMVGTVAARMLRDAPCSVLIARATGDPDGWPRSVLVGLDGSAESRAAFAVARSLGERFDAEVDAVASTRDQFDRDAVKAIAPDVREEPGRAVDVLTSDSADLIVVGSRGLHGLKALGSVSERVAHQARSSVLVVRPGGR